MANNHETDVPLIDARGLACPLPVLKLRKALNGLAPGTVVHLLATDRVALRDVPTFCAAQGHQVVDTIEDSRQTRFVIRRA